MSNPLIDSAPANNPVYANFDSLSDATAGGGIFSDAANTLIDGVNGDWGSLAVDVAGDALDYLSFIEDPFGVLLSAPIGWIIEHIGFLKEALDLLAGDADAVKAKAQTWANISAALTSSASNYETSAKELTSQFGGAAAQSYARAADNYQQAVHAAAGHAADAAKAFELAGAIVGTVRGMIRDSIAQFAADELIEGLAALAASPETFGGSIAAWVTATVGQAASLAARNAADITRVVRQVNDLVGGARSSSRTLEQAAHELRAGRTLPEPIETVKNRLDKAHTGGDILNQTVSGSQDADSSAQTTAGTVDDGSFATS